MSKWADRIAIVVVAIAVVILIGVMRHAIIHGGLVIR
jgi:hypothetical protein